MSVVAGQRRRGRARTRAGAPHAAQAGGGACERTGAGGRVQPDAPTLFADPGGEPTLEELISGVWEGLAAHHRVSCPLCGGEMIAAYGAHTRPAAGRCGDCGTTLS